MILRLGEIGMPLRERPLILMCQEEPESHSLTSVHLISAGYKLVFAGDSEQVRATLNEARRPELAILNWQSGSPQNQAICALLRSDSSSAALPILALGPSTADERMRAVAEGVDDLLPRPVDTAQLLARVRSLLLANRRRSEAEAELHRLTEIGIALSAEHDLQRLLSKIVAEARAINHADAASLYTVDREASVLRFQIAQNETLHAGQGIKADLPPVPLDPRNVSAYVALTGETVNIADVYASQGFDFSGPRQYDALTGYRSQSMLVVPIRDHEDEVIAVLQLINAQDAATGRVVPFQPRLAERSEALASQAGVALTNAQLITDLKALLEGLIQALADAVDQKSSHTAGHIRRVTRLALSLAEAVNASRDERFEHDYFGDAALEELRVAGLLHDIGKIVVPEHLVDKATKLECVHDRISEVRTRFSVIRRGLENETLRRKLSLLEAGANREALDAVDQQLTERLVALDDDLRFVESANAGSEGMLDERLARLRQIAAGKARYTP
ncbi:MAG: GAF domain-containing protein, partial [Actinomycetota bacterium]